MCKFEQGRLKVILVGGMTRIPKVTDRLKQVFGEEPNRSMIPNDTVAMGASVQGGVLAGDMKNRL